MFNFEQMYATTEEMWFVNWVTPILVIHSEKDFRVPPGQGLAAFNSAVLRDVPAKLLYFPKENHWVLQPQNGILWQREFLGWLDKWLK